MPDPAAGSDVQDGNYYAVGTGPTPNGPFASGQVYCQRHSACTADSDCLGTCRVYCFACAVAHITRYDASTAALPPLRL